jgi:hypothetical protein
MLVLNHASVAQGLETLEGLIVELGAHAVLDQLFDAPLHLLHSCIADDDDDDDRISAERISMAHTTHTRHTHTYTTYCVVCAGGGTFVHQVHVAPGEHVLHARKHVRTSGWVK